MVKFISKPMTYGRLWEALLALGFTRIDTPENIVFREEPHDALLVLPIREPGLKLHFWHYAGGRSAVTKTGIASEETFEKMLAKPAIVGTVSNAGKGRANAATRKVFVRPRRKNARTAIVKAAERKIEVVALHAAEIVIQEDQDTALAGNVPALKPASAA